MTGKSRVNRPRGDEGTVPLQGRVLPEARAQAREAAREMGVSMGVYLEMLVLHDAEHRDVRSKPTHVQEALTA